VRGASAGSGYRIDEVVSSSSPGADRLGEEIAEEQANYNLLTLRAET
jgi:hypothetical protein